MGEAVGMAAPYVAFPLAAGERLAAETADKVNASHEHELQLGVSLRICIKHI
jgi:hypothetical protein